MTQLLRKPLGHLLITALLLSFCQLILVPQTAQAGSVNFGTDTGSGFGTVSIPYDAKLDVGDGAFNLEMWVKETSRSPAGGQYTASFWSSTVQHYYHERGSLTSSFMWGLSFDGPNFFAAWRANQNYFYPAGSDMGYTDSQTSNTKTAAQVYNTFADAAWHHIALSKTGVNGTLSMYLDGVRVLYVPVDDKTYSLLGGDVVLGGLKFVGQIGDVRLVKGQALYTGPSITVPTSQITTTSQGALASNVSLLLKASGTVCAVEDVSDNHFSVLLNGATCSTVATRTITSYNVSFDNQGHGTKPADAVGVTSIAFASLPAESNAGNFTFKGWSETTTGAVLTGAYTVTADSTLYAIWEDNTPTSTITYDLNYPSSPTAPTHAPVAQGSTFEVAANPVRSGYQFLGWSDNGTIQGNVYGGPSYIGTTYTVGARNITLTAIWESLSHPIVRSMFHNGGGTNVVWSYFGNGVHTGIDIVPGWCSVLGTNIDPAKNSDPSWIVTAVSHASGSETITSAGHIFVDGVTYQYSPDPAITISTGGTQTVTVGNAITPTATTNTGCGANKYSITPALPSNLSLDTATGVISGTPSTAQASTPYTLTAERWVDASGNLDITGTKIGYSSATFSLKVNATHTITYNLGGGAGTLPVQGDIAEGASFTTASSTGITKAGFTFNKWNDGSTDTSANSSYTMGSSNITLTATWTANASNSVTYNLNGGRYEDKKPTPTQAPVAPGTVFKLASSKELQKTGYTFGGWSDGSRTYAGGASYTMGGSSVVFTATWIAKQYKITWNIRSNNATSGGTSGATTYTAGSSIVTLPTDAVRSGKVFKGWYTSAKGGTKITSGYLVASPFGDVTFYAQFV